MKYYGPEVKSCPAFVEVSEHPVFIIGQNIGHEKDGTHTGVVWEVNQSAMMLWDAIYGIKNLYLTNACNYTIMTQEHMKEGYFDLLRAINVMEPSKIVCLGNVAKNMVNSMPRTQVTRFDTRTLVHPSFIMRMNMDREKYVKELRDAIK